MPALIAARSLSRTDAASVFDSTSRFAHRARLTRFPRKLPHQAWSHRSRARPLWAQSLVRPIVHSSFLAVTRLRSASLRLDGRHSRTPGACRSNHASIHSVFRRMARRPPMRAWRDLPALACRVDGVAAHARVVRRFGHGQPGLHGNLPRLSTPCRAHETGVGIGRAPGALTWASAPGCRGADVGRCRHRRPGGSVPHGCRTESSPCDPSGPTASSDWWPVAAVGRLSGHQGGCGRQALGRSRRVAAMFCVRRGAERDAAARTGIGVGGWLRAWPWSGARCMTPRRMIRLRRGCRTAPRRYFQSRRQCARSSSPRCIVSISQSAGHHVIANRRAARRRRQGPKAAREGARAKRSGAPCTVPSTARDRRHDGRRSTGIPTCVRVVGEPRARAGGTTASRAALANERERPRRSSSTCRAQRPPGAGQGHSPRNPGVALLPEEHDRTFERSRIRRKEDALW